MENKETIEEAAENYVQEWEVEARYEIKQAFIEGYKLAQEQNKNKYSEEEVLPIIEYIQWVIRKVDRGDTPEEIVRLLLFYRDKIEQFKNK